MLRDPVCKKRIKRNRAHIALDYRGVTYYLCCPRCQAEFERAPDQFARADLGEPTPRSTLARARAERAANPAAPATTVVYGPAR